MELVGFRKAESVATFVKKSISLKVGMVFKRINSTMIANMIYLPG